MVVPGRDKLSGVIEIDETYVGVNRKVNVVVAQKANQLSQLQ